MTVLALPYHLDEYLGEFAFPLQPDTTIIPELGSGRRWERMTTLYEQLAREVARVAISGGVEAPVVIETADCTAALGVVTGLQRAGADALGVAWLDAHGDLHTPQSSESGYLGGMPLRMLLGEGERAVLERLRLRPVAADRTVLFDGRDLDPPEEDYLAGSAVHQVPIPDLGAADEAAGVIPSDGPLSLHIDLDVLDDSRLPGLRYPAPDGPSDRTVTDAALAIIDTGRVRALTLSCTWRPPGAEEAGAVADLARELRDRLLR